MKKIDDILITALSKNNKLNAYITFILNSAIDAQKSHKMNILSTSIFCRAMAAGVLLSGNLKNKNDLLSLKWNCTGPVKSIFVEANYEGDVRGYIEDANLQYIDGSLINNHIKAKPYILSGDIVISRKTFDNRPYYNSVTVIETGEIAEDISIYLKQSLQINSLITIAQSIDKENKIELCGGILLMAMPDASEKDMAIIQDKFLSIGSFTELLKKSDNINSVINTIINNFDLKIVSKKNIRFKCNCNKDKVLNILKSLKTEDFISFITDEGIINANCQFCGKEYIFTPIEVKDFYEPGNK